MHFDIKSYLKNTRSHTEKYKSSLYTSHIQQIRRVLEWDIQESYLAG
jgi:hypothetical protein